MHDPEGGGTNLDGSPVGPGAARTASGADDGTDGSGDSGAGTGNLARTGPSPWTVPLLGVGAALVLAGGVLVVEASGRGRRTRVAESRPR